MTLTQWFDERSESERNVLIAAAALLLVLFIGMALSPMYKSLQQNERRVARQYAELDKMKTIAGQSTTNHSQQSTTASGSLVILLQSSARQEGVAIATMQPIGDDSINTRLDDVSFNAMIRWLAALESRGINVQTASLRVGQESGTVDSNLLLRRN
ncbi:MAG: type II secretion system protein GspM [Gammaproteobacteria bacterium]|nr:type II secretion system protein GspM [Gammaproteobacteria bacterium]MCZ6686602.1 type II secretion system protein GspM [Gammaproteobacteria bacterium]MCZ6761645.1 type II secretion system protein GspM [Gammaproteobacteria bacterium]